MVHVCATLFWALDECRRPSGLATLNHTAGSGADVETESPVARPKETVEWSVAVDAVQVSHTTTKQAAIVNFN
jgi:hypothetical protein